MARTNTNNGGGGGGSPGGPTGSIQINNGGSFYGTSANEISPTTGFSSLNASFVAMSDVTYTQAMGSTGSSDDVFQTGGYTGAAGAVYTVTITSTGTGASFSWTCSTGGSGNLVFTGDPQLLNNGFTIQGNNGGTNESGNLAYFVGDTFSWTADNMTASQNTGALFIPGPDFTFNGSINSIYDSTAQNIALTGVGVIGQIGNPGSIGQITAVVSNISGTGPDGIQQMILNAGQVTWEVGIQDKSTGAGSNIGVSPTVVELNTQDALGNQAGVNFIQGGATNFTNQDGSSVTWNDNNDLGYMQLSLGTNPTFEVGDLPNIGNGTSMVLSDGNDQILFQVDGSGFGSYRGFTVQDPSSNQWLSVIPGQRTASIGDLTGSYNKTTLQVLDGSEIVLVMAQSGFNVNDTNSDGWLSVNTYNHATYIGDGSGAYNNVLLTVDDANLVINGQNAYGVTSFGDPANLGNRNEFQIDDSGGVIQAISSNQFLAKDTLGNIWLEVNSTTGATTFAGAYTLPVSDGTNGQGLTTDGSGNVTWQSPPASSAVTVFSTTTGSTVGVGPGNYNIVFNTGTGASTVNLDGSAPVGSVVYVSDLAGQATTYNITVNAGTGQTITDTLGTAQTKTIAANGGCRQYQRVSSTQWMAISGI